MQTAILDQKDSYVTLYDIPNHINTSLARKNYIHKELMGEDCQFIVAQHLEVRDYRTKKTATKKALLVSSYSTRILELTEEREDMTQSDLQGAIDAIVMDIIRECSK